jgi:hypothetical protein
MDPQTKIFSKSDALVSAVLIFAWFLNLDAARGTDMTVSVNLHSGSLKKAGLGSLFGASAIAGGTSGYYLSNSIINVAQSQGRIGENGSNPFSTEAVAPVIRGKGVRMLCR